MRPYNKDHGIFGSILDALISGNSHITRVGPSSGLCSGRITSTTTGTSGGCKSQLSPLRLSKRVQVPNFGRGLVHKTLP